VESTPGLDFDEYVEPTETACGLVYGGVSLLLDRPELGSALEQLGAAFGRIIILVDALEDWDADLAAGKFNLVAAAWPDATAEERRAGAAAVFGKATDAMGAALDALSVSSESTPGRLLTKGLAGRIAKASAGAEPAPAPGARRPDRRRPRLSPLALVQTVLLLGDIECCNDNICICEGNVCDPCDGCGSICD
jgi:hypothetical protein